MRVSIDKDLLSEWPGIRLGVIAFENNNVVMGNKAIWHDLSILFNKVIKEFQGREIKDDPRIRDANAAFRHFGMDPTRRIVSSEALLRRIIFPSKTPITSINSAVDINNYCSIESLLSIGVYDLSEIKGDILFRLGRKGEQLDLIGRHKIDAEGMLALSDNHGPFGSPVADSNRTKVTPNTRALINIIFSFGGEYGTVMQNALSRLAEQTVKYSNGQLSIGPEIIGNLTKNSE
jgi:DNA/RNA-binding domain of Phe-tRNA-synthetase-like protein